ncbi:uroporphyrinogen decarboxylase [Pelagibacteraceae bacterium]|jgi:uroporphyrinogen decarboxylase|nr:uroporphyrinogen decarboxylase [Pelagibacteraceae bacterium]
MKTILTDTLTSKKKSCNPIWFMRQAGRYLPEFQEIRKKNKDFIKLCLNSNLSSKITLQPIKRFDLDAAIIFSDILMVPYALGQEVNFIKGEGPRLSEFNLDKFLNNNTRDFERKLNPVYEAIKKTRNKLAKEKALISFVGAPWTLLVYMLNLKIEKNKINQKKLEENKKILNTIIDKLVNFLKIHIEKQMQAGASTIQIFDSWAGLIPEEDLKDLCYEPNLKLVEYCKSINMPVICFPKGIKYKYLNFLDYVKPNGINIDYDLNPIWAKENLKNVCIQGGMDPKVLFLDDTKMFEEAEKYLKIFKNSSYIFNLGHGLLPETQPEKVSKLIKFVRNYK